MLKITVLHMISCYTNLGSGTWIRVIIQLWPFVRENKNSGL
jgi:hypothetical protein